MKSSIACYTLLCACLMACSQAGKNNVSEGHIADATMNTVTICSSEGDTLSFSTMNAGRSQAHGLLIGDSINVFYHGKYQEGIPADSLVVYPQHSAGNDALGTLQEHTYEGTLPAASCPGIRYHLTIRNKEHSGDGTFALTLTYLEAENGEDRTFSYTGKRYTQRGTPDDNDATVWQMIADNEQDIFNFLVESDSTLVLLNDRFERNKSDLNYSLVRVK